VKPLGEGNFERGFHQALGAVSVCALTEYFSISTCTRPRVFYCTRMVAIGLAEALCSQRNTPVNGD